MLQYEDGYYPYTLDDKKKMLPKTITATFYNAFSVLPSVFLKNYVDPPKFHKDNVQVRVDKYPEITKLYLEKIYKNNVSLRQTNMIIKYVSDIVEEHSDVCTQSLPSPVTGNKISREVFENGSFKTYFGTTKNPFPMIDEHILYLENVITTSSKDINITPKLISTSGGWWNNFVSFYQKTHNILFYPNDIDLKYALEEYIDFWKSQGIDK